jgi:hypothetical protein
MVQGSCAHLQLHETSTVLLDRQNVIIDRLNVISSGSVHPCLSEVYHHVAQMQNYVSKGTIWQQYFEVRTGRNVDCTY